MADYQKYMFDDFVVESNNKKVTVDNEPDLTSEVEIILEQDNIVSSDTKEEDFIEDIVETKQEEVETESFISQEHTEETSDIDIQSDNYVQETKVLENIVTYTQDEYQQAIAQAQEVAYNKGFEEAKTAIIEKQNILLEDIKNQLMTIFASLEEKKSDLETSALNFAVSLVEKILPTLEKEVAEKEVKIFLAENFANFSSQESLSFSFNPDMLSHISSSIRRLAEQNDFEGKISVHKDLSLGLSDCRVEWKSGGVERKTSTVIDKVKNLINTDKQERENG